MVCAANVSSLRSAVLLNLLFFTISDDSDNKLHVLVQLPLIMSNSTFVFSCANNGESMKIEGIAFTFNVFGQKQNFCSNESFVKCFEQMLALVYFLLVDY